MNTQIEQREIGSKRARALIGKVLLPLSGLKQGEAGKYLRRTVTVLNNGVEVGTFGYTYSRNGQNIVRVFIPA